ncbi:MAG: 5-(carboxyamino)imidazole ribonucleotide mutase [Rhizobiales bacterium]|nr:5-(carboxyamino)imidazole ribonucleotide mutase [Hyphomicrobiales bacterium]
MGSQSDWPTMRHAADRLDELGVRYEARIASAHRTPDRVVAFAKGAQAAGYQIIVAGAGGAAALPGMIAALTALPVLGVPIETGALKGQDSLFSIVQMPAGAPVGALAIGKAGASNAGLLPAAILALADEGLAARLAAWRAAQSAAVAERPVEEELGLRGSEIRVRQSDELRRTKIIAIDHVQLAMPAGREAEARAFYSGVLGMREVGKPANLANRGGCWFEAGAARVHLGVEKAFRPARKAHPAFIVPDLAGLSDRLNLAGRPMRTDGPLEGYARAYVDDPFGNRLELMQPDKPLDDQALLASNADHSA